MVVRLSPSPAFRGLFFSAICFWAVLFSAFAHAGGSAPERYPVAMRNFGVWEPHTKERLDFSIWYPSRSEAFETVRDGWIVEASQRGRILPGFYPVILVSHDTASGRFANNDLVAALASGGMIVIVPAHTGDNQNASEGLYTAGLLRDRPRHLLRALETVLGTPEFALHADESRIGLLGIGFGGITAMQLAGAAPDFSRLQGYCGAASGQDAFCSLWTMERLAHLPEALAPVLQKEGEKALSPPLALFAPPLIPALVPPPEALAVEEDKAQPNGAEEKPSFWKRMFGGSAEEARDVPPSQGNATEKAALNGASIGFQNPAVAQDFQGDPLFGGTEPGRFIALALPDSPQFRFSPEDDPVGGIKPDTPPVTADPKVNAYRRPPGIRKIRGIALLAPAGGMLFSRASLAGIHVPVAVVEAGQDGLYPPQQHSYPYFVSLSVQPMLLQLPKVDHFSLFARCARDTMINLGDVCGRMVGDARQDLNAMRDGFLVPFFQSALGGPLPPAEPSGFTAAEQPEEQP